MAAIHGRYRLPDDDLKDAKLTIEITMSVENWRALRLDEKWPEWQVAAVISDALSKFDEMAGRRFVVGHDLSGRPETED